MGGSIAFELSRPCLRILGASEKMGAVADSLWKRLGPFRSFVQGPL
jgi:hypothetical protein